MTDAAGAPRGIEPTAVSQWLSANVDGVTAPFQFELIAAGGSNLTYRVTDANGATMALRRPPVGTTLATAHDTNREFRVMRALAPVEAVPVPMCLAFCEDPDVTGAGFLVMEFVEGTILRTEADAAHFTPAMAERATDALIAAQVGCHTLDLEATGLADLGRHDDYVGRQLRRWHTQVERARVRDVPLIDSLHAQLADAKPTQQSAPGLVHGDYRFDNVVLDDNQAMAAVLDWELCTIGDPLADFVWSLSYWARPGDTISFLEDPPTAHSTFPDADDVVRRYQAATGTDISGESLAYYRAFSWWKFGCIIEGVYARRLKGAGGGAANGDPAEIAHRVDRVLAQAQIEIHKLG